MLFSCEAVCWCVNSAVVLCLQDPPCPWDFDQLCTAAAEAGSIELLQWLRQQVCLLAWSYQRHHKSTPNLLYAAVVKLKLVTLAAMSDWLTGVKDVKTLGSIAAAYCPASIKLCLLSL